jgi:SAM-dependent methyltransferase
MFIYNDAIHNYESAKILVPKFIDWFNPNSVIDVGCGRGYLLSEFKKHNVIISGVEGSWINQEILADGLTQGMIYKHDLNDKFIIDKKFDLCISLEVAEHLNESSASDFIDSLTSLSNSVIFSAAFPDQTGQGHINEQWPNYWIAKFEERGFKVFDFIRPAIWNEETVRPWYKQNMFFFTKQNFVPPLIETFNKFAVIHPQTFLNLKQNFESLRKGSWGYKFYLLTLVKSIQTAIQNRLH